ncbi:MAG: hypothetical protein KKF85_10740 [Gammaproteobacteria bacterium]|nr:hypothetical protein [Gammaproteobacteria bacterium]MBU4005495.1 hypothetical protein [Gammaproteobacteria bacterium]MBU4020952.1 hypothetical protein [Gammaproteobacteria bacterium]MBU4096771.1 hypothetical protein [Gammaproteobacteria bacterium]MBU4147431.1 hypothetical protein [Gammaproteobacteria bacterium]
MDPLTAAIVGSVISSAAQGLLMPPPEMPATGIVRTLPAESKTGVMQPLWQGEAKIDGKTYMLSPGAQIRDELNMIIFPTMVQTPVRVRYQLDYAGAVHRVWILSSAEARLPGNR